MAAVTATGTWQRGTQTDTGKEGTMGQTDIGTWEWGQKDMGMGGQAVMGT